MIPKKIKNKRKRKERKCETKIHQTKETKMVGGTVSCHCPYSNPSLKNIREKNASKTKLNVIKSIRQIVF
jgi:hypothetical protein